MVYHVCLFLSQVISAIGADDEEEEPGPGLEQKPVGFLSSTRLAVLVSLSLVIP